MEQAPFITVPLSEYQRLLTSLQEISSLRTELDQLEEHFALSIAEDRRRISELESHKLEPRNRDRCEVLTALIIRNGGKISRQDSRKLMRLSESQFSQLLSVSQDFIKITASRRDKRVKILSLK